MAVTSLVSVLAAIAFAGAFGTAVRAADINAPRAVSVGLGQFAVVEADSVAAERLEKSYPGRLRRLSAVRTALQLNNVTILPARAQPAAAERSVNVAAGAVCLRQAGDQAPNGNSILVCTDTSNTVSERDQRALRAFISYAQREALPLAAHVSSEREWTALEKVLADSPFISASHRVPFKEVRYGDGLASGQIKIERATKR